MFPASKLRELSPRTRLRKAARILQGIEVDAAGGHPPDHGYLSDVLLAPGDDGYPGGVRAAADRLAGGSPQAHDAARALIRGDQLPAACPPRRAACRACRVGPGEPGDRAPGPHRAQDPVHGPSTWKTCGPRSMSGLIFRTAEAFGAQRSAFPAHAAAEPPARPADLPRCGRLPSRGKRAELTAIAELGNVFALELGGTPIDSVHLPARRNRAGGLRGAGPEP